MKNFRPYSFVIMLVVTVLSLLLVACGGGEPTATPEPVATDTPAPTNTPEPTETPEPTPTPEPAASFTDFESAEGGYSLQYPEDWFTSEVFGFATFASNQELLDSPDVGEEGGVAIVIAGDTAEFESDDPVAALNMAVEEFDLADDAEVTEGPTATTINGQDAATAVIHGTSDNDTPLTAYAAVVINDDRAVIFLGATPSETESEFLPTFQAIAGTIDVGQPAATEAEPSPPLDTEGVLLYGDTVTGMVTEEGPSAWGFIGLEREVVDVIVDPLDDELDVIVDVLDESGNSILESGEVDDSFGREEIRDLELPTSSQFVVSIRGYEGTLGEYELVLLEAGTGGIVGAVEGTIDYGQTVAGNVASGEASTWRFVGAEDELVDITVAPIDGEEEFDVVVDVLDETGNSILEGGELDDSFDTEYVRVLRLPGDGEYTVAVRGYDGATGAYDLTLALANDGLPGSVIFAWDSIEEAGEEHMFPFTAPADEVVTAQVDPDSDLDVVVSVYDDDTDEILDEIDFSTGFEEMVFTTPADGNYYFQVTAFEDTLGTYDITLLGSDFVLFELTYGDTIIGRFGGDSFIEYLFGAAAGDTINLTAKTDDDVDLMLEFLDLDDNVLAEADDTFTAEAEQLTYTAEEEGLIIIRVSDFFEAGLGEFVLSID